MSIFIHQACSNINKNSNNRKLNYKHIIKYYNLLQNWQKPFIVEIHRNKITKVGTKMADSDNIQERLSVFSG